MAEKATRDRDVLGKFNKAIAEGDIEALYDLMTPDHVFIDTLGSRIRGREAAFAAWSRFFDHFPRYRNVVHSVKRIDDFLIVAGESSSKDPRLCGPAIWRVRIDDAKVGFWQVFEDTPRIREAFGLGQSRG